MWSMIVCDGDTSELNIMVKRAPQAINYKEVLCMVTGLLPAMISSASDADRGGGILIDANEILRV